MNADLSVAPEIAQLALPFATAAGDAAAQRTDGRVARDLADLAASPERWWDLVRFDPAGPLRIPVPDLPGSWLLVLPPGAVVECDCRQATALAGEAVEVTGAAAQGRPLRPGRVLVHGGRAAHRVCAAELGYSVTLHATVSSPRSLSVKRLLAGTSGHWRRFSRRRPVLSEFSACLRQSQRAARSPCGCTRRIITRGDAVAIARQPELGTS